MPIADLELKPCPFCGGTEFRIGGRHSAYIECQECSGRSGTFANRQYAAENWNHRTPAAPMACPKCGGNRLKLREFIAGRRPVECLNCDWEWDEPV